MDLLSYQPDRLLVLAAPRKNDPFRVAHGLRAMLLWPLLPLWLAWLVLLGWRRDLRIDKPLWVRSLEWDADRKELRVRYGLWPLHFGGRKVIGFEQLRRIELTASTDGDGVIELRAAIEHAGGSLACRMSLARAFDLPAAEGLLLRIARVSGWRHVSRHEDGDSVRVELAQTSTATASTATASTATASTATASKPPKRPPLGSKHKRHPARVAPPSSEQQAALRRASSWQVTSWRGGEAVELRKPWDFRAVFVSLLLILPLSPVSIGFLVVGAGAFLLVLPTMLETWGLFVIPARPFAVVALVSVAVGALAMLLDVARGYLGEYGPRRVRFDWKSRTIEVSGPLQQVAVAFEDVEAVVVRGPWQRDPPTHVGFDVRPAVELQLRGSDAPLRLLWIAYTRGHTTQDRKALAAVATAAARALGVPRRRTGYEELETR